MSVGNLFSAVAIAALLLPTKASLADAVGDRQLDAQYTVQLAGITMATVNVNLVLNKSSYEFLTNVRMRFGSDKAALKSYGTLGQRTVSPGTFAMDLAGDEPFAVEMKFKRRNVVEHRMESAEKHEPKPPSYVAIGPHHLKRVFDPLSGLLAVRRQQRSELSCQETIPFFTGSARFNIKLTYQGIDKIQTSTGQTIRAIKCLAKVMPIAGYDADDPPGKSLQNVRVWFVPFGAELLLPYRVEAPGMLTSVVVMAKTFRAH